jgi:hypothetical protein
VIRKKRLECQHTPSMSREPETGDVRLKNNTMKRLGEKVGSINNTRSVIYKKKLGFNMRTNKMITDVYVLGFPVIGVVGGEGLGTIIVSPDDEGRWTRKLELRERLSKPYSFLNRSCERNVLGFSGRESNAVLFLCGPADGSSTERPHESRDRGAIFLVSSPVGI